MIRAPLILLPAQSCDGELYAPQVAALADDAKPLALVASEPSLAACAARILDAAPARFLLAGTSFGGSLALEIAAIAPERLLGIWLMGCNPGPHADPEGARRRSEQVTAGGFAAMVDEAAKAIVASGGPQAAAARDTFRRMALRTGPDLYLRQNAALIGRADRRSDLAAIAVPTLLLWGREDVFCGVQHAEAIAAALPKPRLVILEGCGHLPSLERPDETIAAARDWIANATARLP